MTALIFGGLWKYLAAVGVALAAIIAALVKARRSGAAANQAKHDAAESAAVQEAKKIDDAVAGRADADNKERLGKWSR